MNERIYDKSRGLREAKGCVQGIKTRCLFCYNILEFQEQGNKICMDEETIHNRELRLINERVIQ